MLYDKVVKVVVIGDSGVGKTCLMKSLAGENFVENHVATIGVDFISKHVEAEGFKIKTIFWDTCGQERYRSVARGFFRGANVVLLVYDVTDADSFLNVRTWLKELELGCVDTSDLILFLLGNKSECSKKIVDFETAQGFATEMNLGFLEVSAKTGENVSRAFDLIMAAVVQKIRQEGAAKKNPERLQGFEIQGRPEKKNLNCCSIM